MLSFANAQAHMLFWTFLRRIHHDTWPNNSAGGAVAIVSNGGLLIRSLAELYFNLLICYQLLFRLAFSIRGGRTGSTGVNIMWLVVISRHMSRAWYAVRRHFKTASFPTALPRHYHDTSISFWGWSGGAKVCILRHRGVQLILAYSWAKPANL